MKVPYKMKFFIYLMQHTSFSLHMHIRNSKLGKHSLSSFFDAKFVSYYYQNESNRTTDEVGSLDHFSGCKIFIEAYRLLVEINRNFRNA
jgi:hypothetical protein